MGTQRPSSSSSAASRPSSFRRLHEEAGPLSQQQMLVASDDHALLSTFVAGLMNSVLIQALRRTYGRRQLCTVYAVYREDGVTFDDIVEFDTGGSTAPLGESLRRLVNDDDFEQDVLGPMVRKVRKHFGR